jgi:parvulin-like peptidyl-prolyl isomerase
VLDRLINGESFVDLAAELSTDTSNKDNGGDLGWFTRDAMVTPFADAAFALEVGEISQPVETNFGWHIIQLLGKETRPLDATQLDDAKSQAYQAWLETAKTEAGVETFDRWMEIVPTEPAVPDEIRQGLIQLQQQQESQQVQP